MSKPCSALKPSSTRPPTSVHVGTQTTRPSHSAAMSSVLKLRCSGPTGAKSLLMSDASGCAGCEAARSSKSASVTRDRADLRAMHRSCGVRAHPARTPGAAGRGAEAQHRAAARSRRSAPAGRTPRHADCAAMCAHAGYQGRAHASGGRAGGRNIIKKSVRGPSVLRRLAGGGTPPNLYPSLKPTASSAATATATTPPGSGTAC